jgi:hypothetical protein
MLKNLGNITPKIVRLVIGNQAFYEGNGEAWAKSGVVRFSHRCAR